MRSLIIAITFVLTACAHQTNQSENLFRSLCGNTYAGKVVSQDPQDEDWRKEKLVLGPIKCNAADNIEMPLAVGANTSRTWLITGAASSLELRHQHLHDDGTPDAVSLYGGFVKDDPRMVGNKWVMSFPADKKTIDMFNANDLEVSTTNVWTIEFTSGYLLAYELNREGRHFRVEIDLTKQL